jgi:hypothetical protein
MLKCSQCGTEDQNKFSESRKKRPKNTKEIHNDWCKECLKQVDIERRRKKKLDNNLTKVVTCPKCNSSGDFSSKLFTKNRYLMSDKSCVCKKCIRATIEFKLRRNQKKRIKECIENYKQFKNNHQSSMTIIGCTPKELIIHLEGKFKENMTWENYGSYWHIDHIKPIAAFNLSNEDEILSCFNYKNLQPLTVKENLEKGSKYLTNNQ